MNLGTRLLLPLLAAVALVMAAYGAWAQYQRQDRLFAELERETEAYANALGLLLEDRYDAGGIEALEPLLGRVAAHPADYLVLVYDTAGTLLAASAPDLDHDGGIAAVLETARTGRPGRLRRVMDGEPVISVFRPVRDAAGETSAVFEVAQTLTFVQAEVRRTRQRFVLNTVTLLAAVTGLILVLVHRFIAVPLSHFVAAAQALGRGELGHRIPAAAVRGELAELATEFNRMADQLAAARAELVRTTADRLALERRLRETEKLAAAGNLAAGLAHEIAAPLHVIGGRAELLQNPATSRSARDRNIRIIRQQIDRIAGIVRKLLDFTRRREPQIQPVDVHEVLDAVLELLGEEIRRSGIGIERSGPRPARVAGDADLLQQVFLNILINAVHAVAEVEGDRRIAVHVAVAGEATTDGGPAEVTVAVEDSGPGVGADVLPRIFDPFFTTKGSEHGTGLGLAVARSIVEEHGGRLDASNGPAGARFRVHLPAVPEQVAAHA